MKFAIEKSVCSISSETDRADPIVLIKLLQVSTSPQHLIDDILIKTEIDFDAQVKMQVTLMVAGKITQLMR